MAFPSQQMTRGSFSYGDALALMCVGGWLLCSLMLFFFLKKKSKAFGFVLAYTSRFYYYLKNNQEFETGGPSQLPKPKAFHLDGERHFTDFAIGMSHILVITPSQELYGWGSNADGELVATPYDTMQSTLCVYSKINLLRCICISTRMFLICQDSGRRHATEEASSFEFTKWNASGIYRCRRMGLQDGISVACRNDFGRHIRMGLQCKRATWKVRDRSKTR